MTAPARESALTAELRTAIFATSLLWTALAGAMLAPALMDFMAGNPDWRAFGLGAVLVGAIGGTGALAARGPVARPTPRLGFLLVNLSWFTAAFAAAAPLVLSGMSITDAFFEMASGLTTTGSTVIAGLDTKPPGLLLWRSMTHWIGGIGVITLTVVVLPFLRIGGLQLFNKESSDQSERPLPRFIAFGRSLIGVYVLLTAACFVAYNVVGLSAWEALNHAMSTVSTGGFSTHDASMAWFANAGALWVGVVFMLLGAMPFGYFVALLFGRRPSALDPQIPVLLAIVAVAALSLAASRENGFGGYAFAEAVFNVTSVVTTTGFAAGDYTTWSFYAAGLFLLLTFLGGAAGSTAGGVKTYRLIVAALMIRVQLARLVQPSITTVLRYGGRVVDPAVFRSAIVFIVAFGLTLHALTLSLALCGLDFTTAYTGALTALTNVGPGLGDVIGPAGNFAPLPDAAKWLLAFGMILGRLEILPVLVMATADFWRS